MDNKSGNTPLSKDEELSKKFGFAILIKDESKNPFGTYKDRRSELIIQKAKNEQIETLVLITSGNAGYSLERFSQGLNIRIVNIIDKGIKKSIKEALDKYGEIIEVDLYKKILNQRELISLARKENEEKIWDVTNGFDEAYEKIIGEIRNTNPDYIILPVGSGEFFVGVYNGVKKYKLKTKLIGVSTKNKWNSFADKLHTPWTPYKSRILTILKDGNKIVKLNEEEIKKTYKEYRNKFDIEPSSGIVFGILPNLKFKETDKIVIINSGKGRYHK